MIHSMTVTVTVQGRTCEAAVEEALRSGYRLVDTASMYGNEAEVGRAVRSSGLPREAVFVSSKLYPTAGCAVPHAPPLWLTPPRKMSHRICSKIWYISWVGGCMLRSVCPK